MLLPSLNNLHELTGLLVDVVILAGAVVAVIKFRLFNILGHRWRSDLTCNHHELSDSSTVFTADYTISNTGQRPLRLNAVTIRITATRSEDSLIFPDESKTLATRIFQSGDPKLKGLFQIEPGERSIFPIRALLPNMDETIFVLCEFTLQQKRVPGAYRGFYVKSSPSKVPKLDEQAYAAPKLPLDDLTDSLDL